MSVLSGYNHFTGRHWETGSVSNHYAYRGVKAQHTGQPYSEALLLGISGGAVMGYFSFAYKGYDPHVALLTRNTFDPLDRLLERLGVVQNWAQTTHPERGVRNLVNLLDEGVPPIVWADMYSLPYNALPLDDGMWGAFPLVVYGYDTGADRVFVADRARVPLTLTTTELAAARGRIKAEKFRLLSLDPPDPAKLVSAVLKGIWDCIRLYTEAPPKGAAHNFGFAAYRHWAELLTKPKQRMSWEKEFPAGSKMYAGLVSAFESARLRGLGDDELSPADRGSYADFLDEAAVILDRPALKEAAGHFRRSARLWGDLSEALLPDGVAPFGEARRQLLRRHSLFLNQGVAALADIREIDNRLREIKTQVSADFPLDANGVADLRQNLASHVMKVHDIEREAIETMQSAMS